MLTHRLRTIRSHLERNGDYVTSELRTKQIIIDPLLRVLGWNIEDPSQVWMEARFPQTNLIPDYALFRRNVEATIGIIEAKALEQKIIDRFRRNRGQRDEKIREGFKQLASGDPEGPLTENEVLFDPDTWTGLKEKHEGQLEGYIREIGLTAGFAVLTNGDDWWIYDIAQYDYRKGMLRKALVKETSLLYERPERVADALLQIRHGSSWPKRIADVT